MSRPVEIHSRVAGRESRLAQDPAGVRPLARLEARYEQSQVAPRSPLVLERRGGFSISPCKLQSELQKEQKMMGLTFMIALVCFGVAVLAGVAALIFYFANRD